MLHFNYGQWQLAPQFMLMICNSRTSIPTQSWERCVKWRVPFRLKNKAGSEEVPVLMICYLLLLPWS